MRAEEIKPVTTRRTPQHREIFEIPLLVALPLKSSLKNTPTGAADSRLKYTLDASVLYAPLGLLMEEFGEEKLMKRGLELKSGSEFVWNGSQAVLMKLFQPLGDGRVKGQWLLAIDRKDHTWMVSGAYDAKNQESAVEILDILKSAWWDPNEGPVRVSDAAQIGIDTSGTPFKLAKVSSGALIYTKDGKLPTESSDGAIFVASKINNIHIAASQQAEFAKTKCERAALGCELEIISEKTMDIAGKSVLEIVARADDEEEETLIYQTMLFGVCDYNTMVGIARADGGNVEHFKKLTENCLNKFIRP